jgi:single-strand DNA-binding protein
MLNTVIMIGRLTRDPELRITPSGVSVASFTVAVDRPARDDGSHGTDFIDCVAWRKLGELVAEYLTKGRLVAVEGRLQTRTYETQDGQKRRAWEVVADQVRFLDRAKEPAAAAEPSDAAEPAVPAAVPDDMPADLPF